MGFIYLQGGASFQPWYILSYCSTLVRVFVTIEKMDKFLMHIIILYVF